MDPAGLSGVEWTDIDRLITGLWLMMGLVLFFVTNLLIGLVFIPSLVSSYHLPSAAEKARPVFYVLGLASFAAAIGLLVRVVDLADVIDRIYPDYWI